MNFIEINENALIVDSTNTSISDEETIRHQIQFIEYLEFQIERSKEDKYNKINNHLRKIKLEKLKRGLQALKNMKK